MRAILVLAALVAGALAVTANLDEDLGVVWSARGKQPKGFSGPHTAEGGAYPFCVVGYPDGWRAGMEWLYNCDVADDGKRVVIKEYSLLYLSPITAIDRIDGATMPSTPNHRVIRGCSGTPGSDGVPERGLYLCLGDTGRKFEPGFSNASRTMNAMICEVASGGTVDPEKEERGFVVRNDGELSLYRFHYITAVRGDLSTELDVNGALNLPVKTHTIKLDLAQADADSSSLEWKATENDRAQLAKWGESDLHSVTLPEAGSTTAAMCGVNNGSTRMSWTPHVTSATLPALTANGSVVTTKHTHELSFSERSECTLFAQVDAPKLTLAHLPVEPLGCRLFDVSAKAYFVTSDDASASVEVRETLDWPNGTRTGLTDVPHGTWSGTLRSPITLTATCVPSEVERLKRRQLIGVSVVVLTVCYLLCKRRDPQDPTPVLLRRGLAMFSDYLARTLPQAQD